MSRSCCRLGGEVTGHGVGVSGEEEDTVEAILMRGGVYEKKWRQFVEECCYDVASEA